MRKGLGFTVAWVGATIVAIVVAAAAVGSVRSQVTETPTALGAPTAVALAVDTPVDASGTTSTTSVPVGDLPTATTITSLSDDQDPGPTTTQPGATATTSTTSTTAPATTTTTTAPPAAETLSYDTAAGTVRITVSGESVMFAGATADPGWTVELEESGPPEVEVHFEHNADEQEEVEFHAKFEDGRLVVSIS